ncbi:5-methylcytosine restriction system specificity protein McrC [Streptomyces sp. INA 01156]
MTSYAVPVYRSPSPSATTTTPGHRREPHPARGPAPRRPPAPHPHPHRHPATLPRRPPQRRPPAACRRAAARLDPTRLNARYAPLLRLAELLSNRSVQLEGASTTVVDGFLLDMPAVFERFLTLALGGALARHGIRCAAQEQHHRLDTEGRVRMRPDLALYRKGRIITVVDAKYATLDTAAPPTGHLYQLLSYCTALGLRHGHLVYVTTTRRHATDHVIRRAGITVTAHALNLDQPSAGLLSTISALAAHVDSPLTLG